MKEWMRKELETYSKDYALKRLKQSLCVWSSLPEKRQKKADDLMVRLLSIIPEDVSVEKKVALLYWSLSSQIRYDKEGVGKRAMPYTMLGALYNRKAVCMGLAELFSYMCYLLEIPAVTVIGYYDSRPGQPDDPDEEPDKHGPHAWNMVRLSDGRYYHLDLAGDLHTPNPHWRPSHFLKSDAQMRNYYWLPEDYPKADRAYPEQIRISQKGVDLFCQHWQALAKQLAG